MNKWWPVVVVVTVVVGAGAFYGGMRYGEGKPPSPEAAMETLRNLTPEQAAQMFRSGGGFPGMGGFRRNGGTGGGAGGFVTGDIVAKDAQSITVKLPDGSTKIVFYSDSTTISRSAPGSAADLNTGTGVTVTGTPNSDGSVTAQRIQIRPAGEGPFGAAAPTTTTAP